VNIFITMNKGTWYSLPNTIWTTEHVVEMVVSTALTTTSMFLNQKELN